MEDLYKLVYQTLALAHLVDRLLNKANDIPKKPTAYPNNPRLLRQFFENLEHVVYAIPIWL